MNAIEGRVLYWNTWYIYIYRYNYTVGVPQVGKSRPRTYSQLFIWASALAQAARGRGPDGNGYVQPRVWFLAAIFSKARISGAHSRPGWCWEDGAPTMI